MKVDSIKKIAEEILKSKITDEMIDWFNERTNRHIDLVKEYCKKLEVMDKKYVGLAEIGKNHDASKFVDPERIPYIYITWKYKCEDDNKEFDVPEDIKKKMTEATEHHVKNNMHHPEFYCDDKDVINSKDRDKPKKLIDCTKMPELSIAEMVCDWLAMSQEKGTDPNKWADDNINKRWKFNGKQEKLIRDLISKLWRTSKND